MDLSHNEEAWKKLLSYEADPTCSVNVIITNKCNLRCSHCNINEWLDNKKQKFFAFEDFDIFIDNLKKANKKKFDLLFIGGEVLTEYKRLSDFIERYKEYNLHVVTNLVKLPDNIEILKNTKIAVSLDGVPEDHDAIRGSGMFKKTFKNLKFILDNGFDVGIQSALPASYFTTHKKRLKTFYAMLKYLGLEKEKIKIGLIVPASTNATEHSYNIQRLNANTPYRKPCCSYRFMSNFVVTPDGKLYNGYYNVPKKEFCLGTLTSSILEIRESYLRCLNNSHFGKDEKCLKCPALKSCWGLYCYSTFKYDLNLKPSDLCDQEMIIKKVKDQDKKSMPASHFS